MSQVLECKFPTATLSGLEASPGGAPLATIVALHGGGYSAGYWDHPLDPSSSLLTLGALLGYRVVAVDRPGYGASHGIVGDAVRVERQVPLLFELVDELTRTGPVGAGCFLVGHSMGAIVAVHMAASPRGQALLGMEISGIPLLLADDVIPAEEALAAGPDHLPDTTIEFRRELFYGPRGTFDPAILDVDASVSRPIPAAEIIDAFRCPLDVPLLAANVTIPVQFTRAEHETSSAGGREILGTAAGMFSRSRRFVGQWQEASAHNISLHHVARAYHLRTIAFFDEVLADRRRSPAVMTDAGRSVGRAPAQR